MSCAQEFRQQLADAPDIAACAQRCCDTLVEHGYLLPSLYLRRSGRLRCFASNGYWQVLDGFPEESGVISATARTGRAHLVEVESCAEYLRAAPSVVAEACVPIRIDGRVAGALNVESTEPFAGDVLAHLEEVAAAFAARAGQLGGLAEPTGWVLLADNAARLAHVEQRGEAIATSLEVAIQLAGVASGLVALRDSDGDGLVVERAVGPLGEALEHLGRGSLAEIGAWVDGALSCYTVGEPDGQGFTVDDSLRVAGIHSLIVVALAASDERLGYLLVADDRPTRPEPEVVEQLELLATLTAGALMRAQYMSELLALSRRDPLTGLGHQRAFQDRLDQLIVAGFAGTALLSIDVDHFKAVNDRGGHQAGDRLLQDLAEAMSLALRAGDDLFRVGGDEFAAVLHGVDSPEQALEIAGRVRAGASRTGTSVSIGIALGADDNPDRTELFRRADEALYRAKRAGRDVGVVWDRRTSGRSTRPSPPMDRG